MIRQPIIENLLVGLLVVLSLAALTATVISYSYALDNTVVYQGF